MEPQKLEDPDLTPPLTISRDDDYFAWLEEGGRIRTSARAIIVDRARSRFLVEKNVGLGSPFFNFIGGGVVVGETLTQCITRELWEEMRVGVAEMQYLFVVEHFTRHAGGVRHGLEHYFEILLNRAHPGGVDSGVLHEWIAADQLNRVDLRPHIVRDCILEGSYRYVRHLVWSPDDA